MNRIKRGVQVFVTIVLTAGLLRAQQPLPIVRVLLAKNGMAYIVRSGQIGSPLSLTFHPEDMNDIWGNSRDVDRFPIAVVAGREGPGDAASE